VNFVKRYEVGLVYPSPPQIDGTDFSVTKLKWAGGTLFVKYHHFCENHEFFFLFRRISAS
jgi:hypothetical protein